MKWQQLSRSQRKFEAPREVGPGIGSSNGLPLKARYRNRTDDEAPLIRALLFFNKLGLRTQPGTGERTSRTAARLFSVILF